MTAAAGTGTQYLVKKAEDGKVDGFEISRSSKGVAFLRFPQATQENAHRLNCLSQYPRNGDVWTHIAGTCNGVERKLYVNGKWDNRQEDAFGIATDNLALALGAEGGGYRPQDGGIDEIHLYERALTVEDFYALYRGLECDMAAVVGTACLFFAFIQTRARFLGRSRRYFAGIVGGNRVWRADLQISTQEYRQ